MALIAVIFLATSTLAFSLVSLGSALLYADAVNQRELRIQARLNAHACVDTIILMAHKDYFLQGTVSIPELGCIAVVTNDSFGHVSMNVIATLNGVSAYEGGSTEVGN